MLDCVVKILDTSVDCQKRLRPVLRELVSVNSMPFAGLYFEDEFERGGGFGRLCVSTRQDQCSRYCSNLPRSWNACSKEEQIRHSAQGL